MYGLKNRTYWVVLAEDTFLPRQHVSVDIRNHRFSIRNCYSSIRDHRLGIRNPQVGIDCQLGLKGCKSANSQLDQFNAH
jgi:hypothetical protein